MFNFPTKFNFNTIRPYTFAALMTLGVLSSQAAVGYPVGQLDTDLPKVSPFGLEESGVLSAARLINPALGSEASNLKLTGIRFGLTSRLNVSEVIVWAKYSLDEEPFAEVKIDTDVVKGWNDVDLPQPVECENKPFYIGYTIKTSGPTFPIAVISSEGEDSDGFMLDEGEGWKALDAQKDGELAICAIIDGEGIPLYDIAIKTAEVPSMLNNREGSVLKLELLNAGSKMIEQFTLKAIEGDETSSEQEWTIDQKIEPNRRALLTFNYTPLSPTSMVPKSFKIEVTGIEGGDDNDLSNNSYIFEAAVSPYSFEKRLLVEEYTSELCSNCPTAAATLHEAMNTDGYENRVYAVCHHSGFADDGFTLPCDRELVILYGGSTYAPAMSFDREHQTPSSVISHVPGSVKEMLGVFDIFLDQQAPVDMEATGEFQAFDHTLNVKVEGMMLSGTPSESINAMTVYLLEDDVEMDKRQLGADESFRHQHVIRAYNSVWGDPIECNEDGSFVYECVLSVPDGLRPENLSLVAFASKLNPDNHMDCAIANSVLAAPIDWTGYNPKNEVKKIQGGEVVDTFYLTPAGLPTSAAASGVVLKVEKLANGENRVSKLIN